MKTKEMLSTLATESCYDLATHLFQRSGPPPNTTRISLEMDVPLYTVSRGLGKLLEGGIVKCREVGRNKLWYLTDEGEDLLYEIERFEESHGTT